MLSGCVFLHRVFVLVYFVIYFFISFDRSFFMYVCSLLLYICSSSVISFSRSIGVPLFICLVMSSVSYLFR